MYFFETNFWVYHKIFTFSNSYFDYKTIFCCFKVLKVQLKFLYTCKNLSFSTFFVANNYQPLSVSVMIHLLFISTQKNLEQIFRIWGFLNTPQRINHLILSSNRDKSQWRWRINFLLQYILKCLMNVFLFKSM